MPVRPRDAASLILVRQGKDEPEILMGKRRRKASFMPDVYVFPGGKLDLEDRHAKPASSLEAGFTQHLGVNNQASYAQALGMAAVRETFEEAGLMLGELGDVGEIDSESWQMIRETGMAPALSKLSYIGRAITPSNSDIRFHARFFTANAEDFSGELGGSGELEDLHWRSLSETQQLPIIDVTEFMLSELARLLSDEGPKKHPLFSYRNNQPHIRYRMHT
ncbi:MAG: NUDIX hydrolase [Pseudomonadota bacterium]